MLSKNTKLALEEYANNLRYKYLIHTSKAPDFTKYEGLCDFISFYGGEIIYKDFPNKDIGTLRIINNNQFQIVINNNYIRKQSNTKINIIAITLLCKYLDVCEKNKNIENEEVKYKDTFGKIRIRNK